MKTSPPASTALERIRILIVEDRPTDAEIASRVLSRAGLHHVLERVDSEGEFLRALAIFAPDVILCDYSMPHLDGPRVLALAQAHARDVPFIFVSGTIGEDVAVDSLKRGATDYIIKTNMARLPAAVERAIQDCRERVSKERAQRDLRAAQERFALFMQHLPGPAFIKDLQGRLQFVNAAFERMAEKPGTEIVGRTDRELWPDLADPYVTHDRWVADNNRVLQTFESMPQRDGTHSYLVHKFPIPDPSGRPAFIGGVGVDLTARLLAEEKLARLSRIHAFMGGINAALVRTQDSDELLQETCRIAVDDGGFPVAWIALLEEGAAARLVGCSGVEPAMIAERLAASADASREAGIAASMAERGRAVVADPVSKRTRARADSSGGRCDRLAVVGLPVRVDGRVTAVLVLYAREARVFDQDEMKLLAELAGDVSFALEYLAKKERLDYFAYYDLLTGLPNRALCTDRINQVVQSAAPSGHKAAVLVLDIERFSLVNDSLGRQAGDELLKLIGRRLHEAAGAGDTVARIGANAFAVVFSEMRADADVARLLEERVTLRMREPFVVGGQELRIAFKCGVALFPGDGRDAESLLHNAEVALKGAKSSTDRYLFYTAPMNARVAEILSLENALRTALAEEQFVVHYQPKVDTSSNRIYGLEALVRWNRPGHGLVPPDVFLPLVEETGMILDVGMWVMRQAARDQRRWRRHAPAMRVSVNVSSLQLRQKHFVDDALRTVRDAAGDANLLDLEITETVIMEDIEQYIPKLRDLRALGMGVEVDDFGTGYSSLAYLGKLPVTSLKIDRSFVTAMTETADDRTIISTIISLAHHLKLSVVAEGVETAAQRDMLRSLGCDLMQGYHFSRPAPADAIAELLELQ